MNHYNLQAMGKLYDREMDAADWDREIAELTKRQSPEKRAYMIIRTFFELREPSEEMCREFKEWFTNDDTEMK